MDLNFDYNMAKKYDNETETLEGKILSSLLESPKTNTQLLEKLGYGTNRHGNITKPLKDLEKKCFIGYKSVKSEKIDDFCKLWSIIPSYDNFKKMLDDYPSLFVNMHKNELVLNSILEVSECALEVSECSKNVFAPPVQGVPVKYIFLPTPEELKQDLKKKMRLSPEFFRRCFSKNLSQENARELAELIEKLESKSTNEENRCFDNSSKAQNDITILFKVCVFYDVMNGHSSGEAKDYLFSENGKVFEINSKQIVSRTPLFK
jgi:hypothetical protein